MSRRYFLALTILAVGWLLSTVQLADAQKMYKWTDKDGKVHFSNVAPPGEAVEEPSGVTGIEASPSSSAPAAEEAAPPAPAPGGSGDALGDRLREGPKSSVSDESFSSTASATRTKLKRELVKAKEEARAAAADLEAMKTRRDRARQPGLEMLQSAFDPQHKAGSDDEDELRKKKDKADARVIEIRTQYENLRGQAVERNGGSQPAWWLPIE